MPSKTTKAVADNVGAGEKGLSRSTLLAQEWQSYSDPNAGARGADLRVVQDAIQAMHLGESQNGIAAALEKVKDLEGPTPQDIHEIFLSVMLINEPEGLDKDRKDAFVLAIAKELARGGGSGHTIRIDMELPNADIQVVRAAENNSPSDPLMPEVLVELTISADNRTHADAMVARIRSLVEVRGGRSMWPSLPERIEQELETKKVGDRKPTARLGLGISSRKEARLVCEPIVRAMATELVRHTTDGNVCLPTAQGVLRVFVMGGRDPYKNDLARWFAGMEPQEAFQCKKAEKMHCFTVLGASQYANDYRGYKVACRLGDVDRRVREAMHLSFQQISTSLSNIETHGKISQQQFIAAFSEIELVTADGHPVQLSPSQIDDLYSQADIDSDGFISKAEFLRSFKPPKGQLDVSVMEAAGARTRKEVMAGHADAADKENEDRLHSLQVCSCVRMVFGVSIHFQASTLVQKFVCASVHFETAALVQRILRESMVYECFDDDLEAFEQGDIIERLHPICQDLEEQPKFCNVNVNLLQSNFRPICF